MKDGFLRTAAATPKIRVADPQYNAKQIIELMEQGESRGVKVMVFPELCLTGYTCSDLFLQASLLESVKRELKHIVEASKKLHMIAFVGLPWEHEGKLYNAAAAISGGRILGLVPKKNLPNYSEFYELRHFCPGQETVRWIKIDGERVPFGMNLLFSCEDIPGLGKTTMAIAFSRAIGLQKRRVQFTPDVLPSDLTGFTIYQKERNAFVYHPGAVVCNLLLADEINRASPKTQSALLEVMEEGQVTVDGKTRKIAPPFLVIATENPSGSAGTQLLPESQLDRFMVCVKMGYPTIREEMEILRKNENGRTSDDVQQVMTKEELEEAQRETAQIFMHERILEYLVQLAQATREHEMLELGMSPRGTVALAKMAKAGAYLAGREYVVPADVRGVFRETAQHRILLNTRARISKVKQEEVLQEILSAVEPPSLKKR